MPLDSSGSDFQSIGPWCPNPYTSTSKRESKNNLEQFLRKNIPWLSQMVLEILFSFKMSLTECLPAWPYWPHLKLELVFQILPSLSWSFFSVLFLVCLYSLYYCTITKCVKCLFFHVVCVHVYFSSEAKQR